MNYISFILLTINIKKHRLFQDGVFLIISNFSETISSIVWEYITSKELP